jgi:hypothetical protein
MSVLDVLDATRLCSRWSDPDPALWARPVPMTTREPVPQRDHSWRSFARNPRAILMTGLVGADLAKDAVRRAVTAVLA